MTERSPGAASPRDVALLGALLGLAYGYLEGIEIAVLGAIPGILAWRTGNSLDVLWFAPVFYLAAGAIAGVVCAALQRLVRARWMVTALIFGFATAGVLLGMSPAEGVITWWARLLVALGIATQVTRIMVARSADKTLARLAPALLAGIPVLWIVITGAKLGVERNALRGLAQAPDSAPNVLILVLDTQRADHLSMHGYPRPTSPNLDAFAAQGVIFDQAFAPSSWTLPTHASLFTGRLPQEHRAGVMRRPWLDDRFPTLAEAFRGAGYATGGFVANGYWCGRQTRINRGFIHYEDFYGSLADAVARTALGRRIAYDVLPRFGFVDVPGRKNAARVNKDFLEWASRVDDRPFLAFLNYFDVHGPLLPPAPYDGVFAGTKLKRSNRIEIGALTGDVEQAPDSVLREMIDRYDESLLYLDAQLGQLFEAMQASGLLDNTIVAVTSDHGESFGEHGMMFHGHSMFRDQIHVPLIVRHPTLTDSGRRISHPVGIERLGATLLRLAALPDSSFGMPLPVHAAIEPVFPSVLGGVARRSLTPANWPSSRGWVTSMANDAHHFILNEDGSGHLFTLSDVREQNDLARTPSFADSTAVWVRSLAGLWDWR